MFYKTLLTLLLTIPLIAGSLINKVGLPCDPPPVPQYIPDGGYGTYCRFNASYSQVDITFIIDVSEKIDEIRLNYLQTILSNSLKLLHGVYGPENNDISFIAASNVTEVMIPFGEITDYSDLKQSFHRITNWTNSFFEAKINSTAAFIKADENFDYTNNRPKLLIFVTGIFNDDRDAIAEETAKNLKAKNVKIFTIGYSAYFSTDYINNTFLSTIATPGWYNIIYLNSSVTDSLLYSNYSNFVRQTSCTCLNGTKQLFVLSPLKYTSLIGPVVAEYFADCLYNFDGVVLNETKDFEGSVSACHKNFSVNARLVAINSSLKYEFIKNLLVDDKTFWTGKNGPIWTAYFDTTLSVDFIPDNNEITKLICQQQLNITSGNGGILVPYNNTYLFCPAQQTDTHLPLCEAKALDSFDNKALCHGPYINADQRPQQYGVSCSTILENLWLDIILVVDVSKHISVNELDELSKSFMDSFDALNLNVNSQHSSRIALITYATLAKVQMKFGEITNVTQLQKKLSLEKYRNPFDGNRNAKSAFLLAKTLLLLNQSHRRSVVIFVSSGFKSTQNPAPIANILKSLFNTNIITVSTSSDSQNIDNISTYGFNLALNDQFSQSFQFSLSQSNCYCPSNYQQFIFTDPTTKKVTYFAECIFGSNAQKTVNEAFDICSQQKATPIIVTSQAKAAFLIKNIVPYETNSSPIFSIGVKRHYQNINVHMWHEYMQDGYSMGTYPPKLIQFDDLSMNCSMGIIVGETVASLPIDCNKAKLPYICQKQAFDGDHL